MSKVLKNQILIKYIIEWLICALVFLLLFPLFAVLAIMVKLTSPGPVFYISKRLGLNGKIFDIYKFRSLHYGVKHKITNDYKMIVERDDPRLTPIGKFIRIGFDELPQTINVIRHEMTLIGPRPDNDWMLSHYNYALLSGLLL